MERVNKQLCCLSVVSVDVKRSELLQSLLDIARQDCCLSKRVAISRFVQLCNLSFEVSLARAQISSWLGKLPGTMEEYSMSVKQVKGC